MMVNNDYNIQKSWLEQQRIGLKSCKQQQFTLLCDFGTAILEIIASDIQLHRQICFELHVVYFASMWFIQNYGTSI